MSSRQSIVYAGPIHIYNECMADEICIELEAVNFEGPTFTKYNEKYGSPVISKEDLKKVYEALAKYFERTDNG